MYSNSEFDFIDQISHLVLNPKETKEAAKISALKKKPSLQIIDEIGIQVAELIKLQNPSERLSAEDLERMAKDFFKGKNKDEYGSWVYYPWKNSLVHVLPEIDFVAVRTARNKYKITASEQALLATKKIGVVGLSVGQSVAICLAMERSFGELRIADFDTLELGNMNRLRTSVLNLGVEKTQLVVREVAEIDPYLNVKVYPMGLTEENMDSFLKEGGDLDLLIEECDNLSMKILCRLKAKSLGIPVLMDTSDRGMMDIERFDLEPERPIFHGMLTKFGDENQLIDGLDENKNNILMTILDFERLSERAKSSIQEIGKSITTWPQLASSVLMGGAMCAHFAKRILCGQIKGSGRAYIDLDEFFIMGHESKD